MSDVASDAAGEGACGESPLEALLSEASDGALEGAQAGAAMGVVEICGIWYGAENRHGERVRDWDPIYTDRVTSTSYGMPVGDERVLWRGGAALDWAVCLKEVQTQAELAILSDGMPLGVGYSDAMSIEALLGPGIIADFVQARASFAEKLNAAYSDLVVCGDSARNGVFRGKYGFVHDGLEIEDGSLLFKATRYMVDYNGCVHSGGWQLPWRQSIQVSSGIGFPFRGVVEWGVGTVVAVETGGQVDAEMARDVTGMYGIKLTTLIMMQRLLSGDEVRGLLQLLEDAAEHGMSSPVLIGVLDGLSRVFRLMAIVPGLHATSQADILQLPWLRTALGGLDAGPASFTGEDERQWAEYWEAAQEAGEVPNGARKKARKRMRTAAWTHRSAGGAAPAAGEPGTSSGGSTHALDPSSVLGKARVHACRDHMRGECQRGTTCRFEH